ncbi:hypothetical protein [Streptomyces sp. AC495_CC817]|uniref:hypothetical protein n=1 Tax=Streptomyces sp. AC495_CC817 TaxID=2823900 RepID=UPI001C26361F|nr:hypothetical protein [Streptomyces sp. AC495_CC817]
MNARGWWALISVLAAVAVLGCFLPGLVTDNPVWFYYGGILLLVAAVLTVWRMIERRSTVDR